VAVLPFEDLSADVGDGFFAEGLHDELISALAERGPSIDVIARTTMMTFRARPPPPAHVVAAQLGATHVVAGTVRREADRVRVTVQLVDPRTDSAVWSRAYDRTDEDERSLPVDVAADIGARLSAPAARETPAHSSSPRSPEPYELYLKGLVARVAASGGYSRSSDAVRAVEEPLTRAIELDPTFADAYAERAVVRLGRLFYNLDASDAQLELAEKDVLAAERLAPGAPKTLAARAYYLLVGNDFDGALEKFTAAEAAGLADPMWMLDTTTIVTDGRSPAAALRDVERVLAIDPRNPVAVRVYAAHLLAAHRPLDAVRALDLGLEASPGDTSLEGFRRLAVFSASGRIAPLPESSGARGALFAPNARLEGEPLAQAFEVARWSGEIGEFAKRLGAISTREVRASAPGVGLEPVAGYRGWARLLLGDRGAAAADGRELLDYLAATAENRRNGVFLRMLEADAYTFVGDSARAIDAARRASGMPRGTDLASHRDKAIAAIFAWNGDSDDAVDTLERLATGVPGVGPAEIARDPWYTVPLAHDARFQALAARLEEQMRTTPIR
jgi:TolB-like protein/tetratricopeptide (TPR) repeat protein